MVVGGGYIGRVCIERLVCQRRSNKATPAAALNFTARGAQGQAGPGERFLGAAFDDLDQVNGQYVAQWSWSRVVSAKQTRTARCC
jgi:hypothetical protein